MNVDGKKVQSDIKAAKKVIQENLGIKDAMKSFLKSSLKKQVTI